MLLGVTGSEKTYFKSSRSCDPKGIAHLKRSLGDTAETVANGAVLATVGESPATAVVGMRGTARLRSIRQIDRG